MFYELIGTIFAGVAAALFMWAVNRVLKGRLPSWLVPVAGGGAMLLATITSEYSWFSRTTATMPGQFVVAEAIENKQVYRPWTYIKPYVSRFVAVDQGSLRIHPDRPDQRLVDLVFYGRWQQIAKVPALFDCAENARADLVDGAEFGADGEILNTDWLQMDADAPILTTACNVM
ncbi:hypothetical protein FHS72_001277 [Loktanella ponticola]|uniref:Uncharacterized protein n=1 Tax=Yoonia ponticola TaxID=1524255 RepID=A0A7W9BJJ5_9RHOB|nr:hypothetical protein [Yoonia ponticola]MBB5721665.1 hypothetical protein [Yoonia ponticola]